MDLIFDHFFTVEVDGKPINLAGVNQVYIDGFFSPPILEQLHDQFKQLDEESCIEAAALEIALLAQDSLDEQPTVERILDQMGVIAKRLLRTPKLSERTSFMLSYMLLNVREASPEAKEKPSVRGWNPFRLYRNHPDLKEAEAQLKVACAEAAAKIKPIQNQYANCGASDTDSRTAIVEYIWDLLLYPPEQRAADITLWRQVVIEGKSKPTTQRSWDLESANRLLNNMDDADLLATLKLGKEKLPWVREQIKVLDAKYKAELEAITESPEFKCRLQQHLEQWQKQPLGRKQQQQT